jgi:7-cyano-7-deazaguanine reductase
MFHGQSIPLETALSQRLFPVIECFPNPCVGAAAQNSIIRIIFPEFTCVCPKTGYPDFATISLYYQPDKQCIELKSWKLYLNAFRMVGTFHETVGAHLFNTLTDILQPRWLLLVNDFSPRGNVHTTVVFETKSARPASADIFAEVPNQKERV